MKLIQSLRKISLQLTGFTFFGLAIFYPANALAIETLIFGDYQSSKSQFSTTLSDLFPSNNITVTDRLPADISNFDTIYHFGVGASSITASEQSQLANFLANDGGLFLTGERDCCQANNKLVETVINSALKDGAITVGNQGDIGGPYTFNSNAAGDITTTPNSLTTWYPNIVGGIAGTLLDENILVTGANDVAVAGIWNGSHLANDAGKIVLMMDVNWVSNGQNTPLIENIETSLVTPTPTSPSPTAVPFEFSPGMGIFISLGLFGTLKLRSDKAKKLKI